MHVCLSDMADRRQARKQKSYILRYKPQTGPAPLQHIMITLQAQHNDRQGSDTQATSVCHLLARLKAQ